MADQQQIAILQQGVEAWNAWRREHPQTQVNLSEAHLSEADLSGADLSGADLSRAHLSEATLHNADLRGADLSEAILHKATLHNADLRGADLSEAILYNATLYNADLRGANLIGADLDRADLSEANLSEANLNRADLSEATLHNATLSEATLYKADLSEATLTATDMTGAVVGGTHFADLDLRTVKGLETLKHLGPSHINITTFYRSQGQIPESFLREAGIPEDFLLYLPSLVNRAIEYYTCFISYSSKDQEFVERLYADLQSKGVRCWFAPEDLRTGDKIRDRIDQSIRLHDKLLLILSEHSVNSSWVEFEVEAAIAKETSKKTLMLFPIRLDSAVKDSATSWAAHIRRMRHISDFSNWKQHDDYHKAFNRLLRDLKPETPPIIKQK